MRGACHYASKPKRVTLLLILVCFFQLLHISILDAEDGTKLPYQALRKPIG